MATQLLVGSCQYTCRRKGNGYFFDITVNKSSQINEFMCSRYKRQGQLCGSCVTGYAPPVYSYFLSCVNCTDSNWAKYTAVSLLPVTAFFVFAITFRFSATSPKLNGFILCMQILMSPPNMRIIGRKTEAESQNHLAEIVSSMYGIWNLDFFRLVYTPFCLQPDTNPLQILSLDYLIGVYPLLLVVLTYLLVLLYDRNVRLIVILWKPFVPLFIRFRRQWNIKSSLVDAFATFLLFSYVKILSVSIDLLTPVWIYDQNEHTLPQLYLFNQGDVSFLGTQHLPYAFLALFFLITFTLLPMLLLFLYPCSCFQACLNRTGCSCQPLHTFMDTFQGHYKNGTNGTRDFRFFSGLYLLLRIAVYASTMVTYQIGSAVYTSIIIYVLAFSVALAQPHKKHRYNAIESLFLAISALFFMTVGPEGFGEPDRIERALSSFNVVLILIPFLYITLLLFYWLMPRQFISQWWNTFRFRLKGEQRLSSMNREDYESLNSS